MSILRQVEVKDYAPITQIIDDWWGDRPMAGMLHRLFFEHFQPTSFVIEQHEEIAGFLVGFRSQTTPTLAYIHFVGVHPASRGQGIGRRLYEHFFEVARQLGGTEVRAITSPVNTCSIAFHTRMGFAILPRVCTDWSILSQERDITISNEGPGTTERQGHVLLIDLDRTEKRNALPNERQNKHVFVAEAYTDVPGDYVTVKETVRSFKSLLEGR